MERQVICRYLRRNGVQCTAPAVDPDADTLLCPQHIAGAIGALETVRRATMPEATREATARQAQERLVQNAEAQQHALVYYARCWDLIKIGTTADITARMRDVRATELLATEPGYYDLEGRRHRQFAHLRVTGEYFTPAPDLLDHVEAIRAEHGPPIRTTAEQLPVGRGRSPSPAREAVDAAGLGAARFAAALRHR